MNNDKKVSYDSEKLILVDELDNVTGYKDKSATHDGDGILHRAFSVFIFNEKGEVLMQQRSGDKRLWPMFWSNSCCSHPRKGETMDVATQRRLEEELGFSVPLEYLYKFQYSARYEDKGSENELCYVYIGRYDGDVNVNKTEINNWKFIPLEELKKDLEEHPDRYTPWSKMEIKRLTTEFSDNVKRIVSE